MGEGEKAKTVGRGEEAPELCESRGDGPGAPTSLTVPTVSVDVKRNVELELNLKMPLRAQELRVCVKVGVAVLGSLPLIIVPTVSVDVKQH